MHHVGFFHNGPFGDQTRAMQAAPEELIVISYSGFPYVAGSDEQGHGQYFKHIYRRLKEQQHGMWMYFHKTAEPISQEQMAILG